jgi:hypothetical protein
MMPEIRALTVRQPYASAIAVGGKRVENRSKPTSWRGLTAIHAGLGVDWHAPMNHWLAAGLWPPEFRNISKAEWLRRNPAGAVIAVAELTGCHYAIQAEGCYAADRLCSPWAMLHAFHWQLANVRPLPEPVPCKGMLGLWRLPEGAEKVVREQLEEASRG